MAEWYEDCDTLRDSIPVNVAILSLDPDAKFTTFDEFDGKGEQIIWDETNSNSCPTDEAIAAEQARLLALEPIRMLRRNRNALLAETDWMANSDVEMSDAWKTYRQALRDMPATESDPSNPTWPTKPANYGNYSREKDFTVDRRADFPIRLTFKIPLDRL